MIEQALIQQAKAYDLLALAERHTTLKRVAATGGGEYAGPCPLCPGGRDRFRVQPERHRWMCRYCTQGRWQDAITFQMRLAGQGFVDAVRVLAGEIACSAPALPIAPAPQAPAGPPPAGWQARARDVIERAANDLWSPSGDRARDWLHARGLQDSTLRRWRIGYIPADRHEAAWRWGLPAGKAIYVPAGVLIPCEVQQEVWYAKVRRLQGRPKYTQVRGSRLALYMAETIQSRLACVTEGEFDGLLLHQSLQQAAEPRWQAVGVVTAGSQSARLDAEKWGQYWSGLDQVLVFYDQDGKSTRGTEHWMQVTPRAQVVHWPNLRPGDKDLTDYYLSGGDVVALVAGAATSVLPGSPP